MITSTGWDQLDQDIANFKAGAGRIGQLSQDTADDRKAYQEKVAHLSQLLKEGKSAEGLAYFLHGNFKDSVSGSTDPNDHGNIFGIFDDQQAGYGAQMSLLARLTKVFTDLQNISNGSSKIPAGQQVPTMFKGLNTLLSMLDDPEVKKSLDPDTLGQIQGQLHNQLDTLTHYFNIDANGNPVPNDPSHPKMNSFDDMIKGMSNPGSGDATAAFKELTDAQHLESSLTTNMNAAVNQQFSLVAHMQNLFMQFITALLKDTSDWQNVSQQNQTRG